MLGSADAIGNMIRTLTRSSRANHCGIIVRTDMFQSLSLPVPLVTSTHGDIFVLHCTEYECYDWYSRTLRKGVVLSHLEHDLMPMYRSVHITCLNFVRDSQYMARFAEFFARFINLPYNFKLGKFLCMGMKLFDFTRVDAYALICTELVGMYMELVNRDVLPPEFHRQHSINTLLPGNFFPQGTDIGIMPKHAVTRIDTIKNELGPWLYPYITALFAVGLFIILIYVASWVVQFRERKYYNRLSRNIAAVQTRAGSAAANLIVSESVL